MVGGVHDSIGSDSAVSVLVLPQILLMRIVGVVKRRARSFADFRDDLTATVLVQFLEDERRHHNKVIQLTPQNTIQRIHAWESTRKEGGGADRAINNAKARTGSFSLSQLHYYFFFPPLVSYQ